MNAKELIKALEKLPQEAVIKAETVDGREFMLLDMVINEECNLSLIMLLET